MVRIPGLASYGRVRGAALIGLVVWALGAYAHCHASLQLDRALAMPVRLLGTKTRVVALAGCLLFGVVGLLSGGCSTRVVPSELTGTYQVRYPFGHGSLYLSANGQYEQVLEIDGRKASARGEWKYVEGGGSQGILLQDCLSATNHHGELSPGWPKHVGSFGWGVQRRFLIIGAIELADDEDYHYQKMSSSAAH